MIYFLVNNTYQLYDARIHLSEMNLKGFEVTLIMIPHTLSNPDVSDFTNAITFNPFRFRNIIKCLKDSLNIKKTILAEFKPSSKDILFLYTEFEPFNQVIATLFKNSGSRIFIIEDGGFATYLPFSDSMETCLTYKEKLKEFIVRNITGLNDFKYYKQNNELIPFMNNNVFDGVCLYRPVIIKRNIKSVFAKRPTTVKAGINTGTIIFLNEDLYNSDLNLKDYLESLNIIFDLLSNGFKVIYFKFHPRETNHCRKIIYNYISATYKQVIFIDDNNAIESIVNKYQPEVVASYFSAALLNLHERGVQCLYMYHLIPELNNKAIFKLVSDILSGWGYIFPTTKSEIRSGFNSGISFTNFDKTTVTLTEIVETYDLN